MRASFVFCGDRAGEVARSLDPDNLPGMSMEVSKEEFRVEFSAEKIGTLLATTDDLLMNIKIAEDILSIEERI
jgi:tRNA threonylcarbamoyladenosine modification (KEOPS) complex  Pcc1 subunit